MIDSPVRSPSPVNVLDDSDDEDGSSRAKKVKTKAKAKPPVSIVPTWARTGSSLGNERKKSRSVGRGSTEDRRGRIGGSETMWVLAP